MTAVQVNGHTNGDTNGTNPKMDHLDIEVDHGKVPTHNLKWLPSFPIDTPDEVLRKEFAEKGVIHIKNAMPRELVQGVRARFFEQVSPSGILAEGSKPVDGTWCGERPKAFVWPRTDKAALEGKKEYAKLAADWHIGDESAAFCENPPLMKLVSRMRPDWSSPFCLRRQIFRTWLPGDGGRTGIHYDQLFLRHGPAEETMTAWIPVGDVAPHEGGLIYLEDSVRTGLEAENAWTEMSKKNSFDDPTTKRCDNPNMTQGTIPPDVKQSLVSENGSERKWLVGNYEAGDVVFHHMYMIHASGANMNKENRIRFSADLRFTDRNGKYDPRWDNPFVPGDGL